MKIIEITSLLFEKYIAEKLPTKDQEAGKTAKKEQPEGVKIATWIGPNSNTWDPAQAEKYRKMEKLGYSKEEMFTHTGTIRMNNGNLAQELGDQNQKFNTNFLNDDGMLDPNKLGSGTFKLDELLDHPELFDAYPKLKTVTVKLDKTETIGGGYYNPLVNEIVIYAGDGEDNYIPINQAVQDKWLDTLTHEYQHVIQEFPEKYYFSTGGTPDSKVMQDIGNNILDTWPEEHNKRWLDSKDEDTRQYELGKIGYWSLDGEASAENASWRKDYDDEERSDPKNYPSFFPLSKFISIEGDEIPQHIKDKLPQDVKYVVTKTGWKTYITFPNPDYKRLEDKIVTDYRNNEYGTDGDKDAALSHLGYDIDTTIEPKPIPKPPEITPEPEQQPEPIQQPEPKPAPKATPIPKPTNPGDRAGLNKPKVNPNPNPGIDATTPIQQPAKLPPSGNANIKTPSVQTPPVDKKNPFQMYPDNPQSSTTKPGGHGKGFISTHPEKPPKVNKQSPGKQANERK
ncbi:hypothetical protein [Winogradskyella sp.]|uniref:hypothetical protein n=1 Tax=Winogradskyella sp. TaxID=1883156 RepID=UPI003511C46E